MTDSQGTTVPTAWRKAFAAFIGADQFRKFVRQFHRTVRLRFWQEQLLDRFFAAQPALRIGPDELKVILRVCELHDTELQPDTVKVIDACVDYADWYVEARVRLFPHAATGSISTEGAPLSTVSYAVWYCPECRRAETTWSDERARRALPRGLKLVRQTTLDSYEVECGARNHTGMGWVKWQALRSEVQAELAKGGHLWQWETSGPDNPDGGCGIAVVRDGRTVKHWQLWKS